MGTRCLTVFQDSDRKEICVMYRQFDGYPSSHGNDLKELLGGMQVVNGISGRDQKIANGIGCLAAQVIAHFKKEPGGFYVHPAGTRDCGEEFIYTLHCPTQTGPVHLRVQSGAVTFFGMPGTKQANMPVLYDGPIDDFDAEKAEKVMTEVAKETPNDFLESKKA